MTDGPAHRRPIPPREPQSPVWFEPPTRPLPIAQPIDLYQTRTVVPVPRARRRVDLSVILAGIVMLLLAVGVVVGLATM